MQSFHVLLILFIVSPFVWKPSSAYDMMFNSDRDLNLWKFNGSYIYSRSLQDIAALVPVSLLRSTSQYEPARRGLWLIRYAGPEAENFLSLQYSLHHHLLVQGVIQFIASPNVPVTVTTTGGQQVGKFYSDGKTWCDAIFNVNMMTQLKIDIPTPNSGNYVLLDKVVLGVQANVTQLNGRQINPCKTSPRLGAIDKDDLAPDMAQKSVATRQSYQPPPPPDMAVKPTYHGGRATQGVPDMRERQRYNQAPRPDMRTTTMATTTMASITDSENGVMVENDSSDVKCGCSCSCSRKKQSNATTTTESG